MSVAASPDPARKPGNELAIPAGTGSEIAIRRPDGLVRREQAELERRQQNEIARQVTAAALDSLDKKWSEESDERHKRHRAEFQALSKQWLEEPMPVFFGEVDEARDEQRAEERWAQGRELSDRHRAELELASAQHRAELSAAERAYDRAWWPDWKIDIGEGSLQEQAEAVREALRRTGSWEGETVLIRREGRLYEVLPGQQPAGGESRYREIRGYLGLRDLFMRIRSRWGVWYFWSWAGGYFKEAEILDQAFKIVMADPWKASVPTVAESWISWPDEIDEQLAIDGPADQDRQISEKAVPVGQSAGTALPPGQIVSQAVPGVSQRVLELGQAGRSVRQIADELGISKSSVARILKAARS